MIIVQVALDEMAQMRHAQNEEVVQAFPLDALDPPFRVGVHVGRAGWDRSKLNAVRLQDGAELLGELAVPVADDVRGYVLALFTEEDREVPGLLAIQTPSGLAVMPAT